MSPRPLLVRGGRLVDPAREIDAFGDVLIVDGRVAERTGEALPEGTEILDATGLVVAPGFIDLRASLGEPGREDRETIASGTRAAAAGGFTAVAATPDTDPVNDNRSVTEHVRLEAARHGFARVHPIGAVSKGMAGEELAEMGELAAGGAVAVFDRGGVGNAALLRRALQYAGHFGLPLMQHAEDRALAAEGVMHEGIWSTRLGLAGLPGLAEDAEVARDLEVVEATGGRYHLAHVSTARSLDLVRTAKARGLPVTCDVAVHHLVLTDEAVATSGFSPATKIRPPLRTEEDRAALVAGVVDGTVDAIASDHRPIHPDEKLRSFDEAPFGVVGLETVVSVCLDRLVRTGTITARRLVELFSTSPARLLGLEAGRLDPGRPGDLTLLHLERAVEVDPRRFASLGRSTPFAGWKLRGGPAGTVVGGRQVAVGESGVTRRG